MPCTAGKLHLSNGTSRSQGRKNGEKLERPTECVGGFIKETRLCGCIYDKIKVHLTC